MSEPDPMSSSMWRRHAGVVSRVVMVVLALVASGCSSATQSSDDSTVLSAMWGLTSDPDITTQAVKRRSQVQVGREPAIINRFVSMSLQPSSVDSVLTTLSDQSRSGTITMVTLEPGRPPGATVNTLDAIAEGRLDERLHNTARLLRAFQGTVALRFAHEMNGNWYPWAGDPTKYVSAWRRVTSVVRQSAPNVKLVWSINAEDHPVKNRFEGYWPGADTVDVIGVDGYNCLDGWKTPEAIFNDSLNRIHALSPSRPVWITETASCEASQLTEAAAGASKAEWIEALSVLIAQRGITAVVWFDRDKEFDWRIDSSPPARRALEQMLTGTTEG